MNEYMKNVRKSIKRTYTAAKLGIAYIACIGALAVPLNGSAALINLGIETIAKPEKQTIEAKLEGKHYAHLMQTKGIIYYGDFSTTDGKKIKLYDRTSALDGKIFENGIIPKLKVGETYRLYIRTGSVLGDYVVQANKK